MQIDLLSYTPYRAVIIESFYYFQYINNLGFSAIWLSTLRFSVLGIFW